MYSNTSGLKRNTQSVNIDPLARPTTFGMRKTRSITVIPQFVVVEQDMAPENTRPKVSAPIPIRALPNSIAWENLEERAEQRRYEMSTWTMYDRITTSRMMRKEQSGRAGLLPKFPSLPEHGRHRNIDDLNMCNIVSPDLDSLADEAFEMDML
jgi:hypothetical protein